MNPTIRTFEEAFETCFPRAFHVALRIVNDAPTAEDIASETMVRAYARWRKVSHYENVEAWVVRVASNLAIDDVRRRRRRRPIVQQWFTDSAAERVTSQMTVAQALRGLPLRQREAVVLCHLGGLTPDEASALLNISVNTVRTHTQRGVTALRKSLSDKELA